MRLNTASTLDLPLGLEDEHLDLISPSAHPHPPLRQGLTDLEPQIQLAKNQHFSSDANIQNQVAKAPTETLKPSPPNQILVAPLGPSSPCLLSPGPRQSLAMQTMMSNMGSCTQPRDQGWLAKKVIGDGSKPFYLRRPQSRIRINAAAHVGFCGR